MQMNLLPSDYGAVYRSDSSYESPYDSVYNFLHYVVCNLICIKFFLICVDKQF